MMKVLSTLAVQGALPGLVTRYQLATHADVELQFFPTNGLLERIAAGERADVAILTRAATDHLGAQGVLASDSVTDIAISRVGLAVGTGAPKPDISSVVALKATLLNARSIAYSKIGASGIFFADLIHRLGIADQVNAKAKIMPSGLTAELVARGEAELAIQQLSELMMVAGVDVVGPLPPGADSETTFSAGVFAGSSQAEAGRQLIGSLQSPEAVQALTSAGLEPPRGAAALEPGAKRIR